MRTPSASGLLGVLGTLCLAASTCAQPPAPAPPPTPKALSAAALAAEPYYLKSVSTVNTMNADGTGIRVQTFSIVIQSDSAVRTFSVLVLAFPSQSEHADFVRVRVTHADGTTQDTPVDSAIEQPAPVTREAPLYSDLQTKQLPVKSLRVGDTIDWQCRFTVYHAESPGQFWGQDTFSTVPVTLDETYELRVPAGLHLTVWTNPRAGGSFAESTDAAQHIYRWQHANLKPTVGAEAEAAKKIEDKRVLSADEELDATKGKLPDFAWSTFSDWATVGAWYRTLATDRATPDDAIKAKVAELIAGKSTDLEKAQAVYAFVATHIRYIGIDFGIGRFQPHTAAEVLSNQYGDCKDKHTLLSAMLSVLGIHADPVLVGAGIRFNTAVPSPASFNHVITRLSLGGKDIWLDSTAEIGIWGALLKPIRDQDALVIAAPAALVAHTPADLPYPQFANASVVGSLDKSLTSESKIVFTFHDDTELLLRSVLRSISPSDYGVLVQRMMAGMGFGGTTSEPEIEHIDDPSQPLVIAFHYHRVKEKDWGENRITANFEPIALPAFTQDDPPTSTIELGPVRTEDSTLEMQLPDGWSAELPEAVHAHKPFANCDVTYSIKDHKLIAERRLTVLQSKVPIKDFKQYQSWYDDAGASGYPYIQLHPAPKVTVSVTNAEPTVPNPAPGFAKVTAQPSDPKAADLIQQANKSVQSFDLDNARKLLDQAAAINPTQPFLWSSYAQVAEQLGINTQFRSDMERELQNHPDEVQFYPVVESIQASSGDAKAGLATLHAWVKAAPGSLDASLALATVLLENKAPAEARTVARAAIDSGHPTGYYQFALTIAAARADADLGHAAEAANTVAPLLASSTDPEDIDEVAHILAQGKQHLGDAEAAERTLIDKNEAETASWVPIGTFRTAQVRNQLAAEWNTLALILFQQGHTKEALGYAMASLYADDNARARDVLTTINAVARDPRAAAALKLDSQALRTFPLGPAKGHQGVSTFSFLLGDGKIIGNEPSSTEPSSLPDAASYLEAADLRDLFPPGSKVHLTRVGAVDCHSGTCQLVLIPAYVIRRTPGPQPGEDNAAAPAGPSE